MSSCANIPAWKAEFSSPKTKHVQTVIIEQLLETVQFISQDVLYGNALLPYVNSPLKVDPSTGYLSSAKITMFQNIVSDILTTMQNNEEISGFSVTIDKNQNVLKNDTLIIKYSLVPVGVASRIEVVEGLALTNK